MVSTVGPIVIRCEKILLFSSGDREMHMFLCAATNQWKVTRKKVFTLLNQWPLADYLKFKETIVDENWATDENALEIDFGAMDFTIPHLTLSSSIGNGVSYVSKFLASKLNGGLASAQPLVDYLLSLNHQEEKLMINETLNTASKLQSALIVADAALSALPKDTPYQSFELRFKEWGFEKGWGDTAERVKDTMRSVSEVLQAPDPLNLEKFFGRLPIIFNVVLFSVHGYFGQADVLGLPDTGGQVVYVLDQVVAGGGIASKN